MKAVAAAPSRASTESERQRLIADLFHALNQPLTTLRCSLELTLVQPRTPEQNAETIKLALTQAEHASWVAAGLRELVSSDDPGEEREVLELEVCLQQVVLDLLPLAEAAGVYLSVRRSSACSVFFEPLRLRRALFYLLEYALETVPRGATIKIEICEQVGEAVLSLAASSPGNTAEPAMPGAAESSDGLEQQLSRRLQLAIARSLFEAAGGELRAESSQHAFVLEVKLPVTSFPHS